MFSLAYNNRSGLMCFHLTMSFVHFHHVAMHCFYSSPELISQTMPPTPFYLFSGQCRVRNNVWCSAGCNLQLQDYTLESVHFWTVSLVLGSLLISPRRLKKLRNIPDVSVLIHVLLRGIFSPFLCKLLSVGSADLAS